MKPQKLIENLRNKKKKKDPDKLNLLDSLSKNKKKLHIFKLSKTFKTSWLKSKFDNVSSTSSSLISTFFLFDQDEKSYLATKNQKKKKKCTICKNDLNDSFYEESSMNLDFKHICYNKCFKNEPEKVRKKSPSIPMELNEISQSNNSMIEYNSLQRKTCDNNNVFLQDKTTNNHFKISTPKDFESKNSTQKTLHQDSTDNQETLSMSFCNATSSFDFFLNQFKKKKNFLTVKITPVEEKVFITNSNNQIINFNIQIMSQNTINNPNLKQDHLECKLKIINCIKKKLRTEVCNWNDYISNEKQLGNLLIFDKLNISTNGVQWDLVLCYFFENVLLFINGSNLVGQIQIHNDICSIKKKSNGFIINLKNETIPELQLKHDNLIIICKWFYFISQSINKKPINITIYQITTNAWDIVKDKIKLSIRILEFIDSNPQNNDFSFNKISNILPTSNQTSLNLILSVCLINQSSFTNFEYKELIIKYIKQVINKLRPTDNLGLIFVGSDGTKKSEKKGSFVGFAYPSWDGWEIMLKELFIFSNDEHDDVIIFKNSFEEFIICFEKCVDLFTFLPTDKEYSNRLIILNCNNFYNENLINFKSKLDGSLEKILKKFQEKVSITIIRVGGKCSEILKHIHKLTKYTNNEKKHIITIGDELLLFPSFKSFLILLNDMIQDYQNISIPYLSLFLRSFSKKNKIEFKELNIDDEKINFNEPKNLQIILNNISNNMEKKIILKVNLDLSHIKHNENFSSLEHLEKKVLNYMVSFLNELYEDNVCLKFHKKDNDPQCAKEKEDQQNTLLLKKKTKVTKLTNSKILHNNKKKSFLDMPLFPQLTSDSDKFKVN